MAVQYNYYYGCTIQLLLWAVKYNYYLGKRLKNFQNQTTSTLFVLESNQTLYWSASDWDIQGLLENFIIHCYNYILRYTGCQKELHCYNYNLRYAGCPGELYSKIYWVSKRTSLLCFFLSPAIQVSPHNIFWHLQLLKV